MTFLVAARGPILPVFECRYTEPPGDVIRTWVLSRVADALQMTDHKDLNGSPPAQSNSVSTRKGPTLSDDILEVARLFQISTEHCELLMGMAEDAVAHTTSHADAIKWLDHHVRTRYPVLWWWIAQRSVHLFNACHDPLH